MCAFMKQIWLQYSNIKKNPGVNGNSLITTMKSNFGKKSC